MTAALLSPPTKQNDDLEEPSPEGTESVETCTEAEEETMLWSDEGVGACLIEQGLHRAFLVAASCSWFGHGGWFDAAAWSKSPWGAAVARVVPGSRGLLWLPWCKGSRLQARGCCARALGARE